MSNIKAFAAVLFACACAHVGAEIYGDEFYDPTGSISQYGQLGYSEISFKGGKVYLEVNDAGVLTPAGGDVEEWLEYRRLKASDYVFNAALAALEKAITSEMMVVDTANKMAAILNGGSISVSYGDGKSASTIGVSYNGDGSVSFSVNGLKDNAKADGSTTKKTGDTISVKVDGIVDNTSVGVNSSGKAEIYNWSTAPAYGTTMADALADKNNPVQSFQFLARSSASEHPRYVRLGKLGGGGGGGGVNVDGESIVTNETTDGSASIAGFKTKASNGSIPYADGSSLKWTDLAQVGILEMRESSPRWTSTTGSDMYFGTSHNGGGMAWHPLPNVTTNAVEADGVTLKEINVAQGRKQFAINDRVGDGVFGWTSSGWARIVMPTFTNNVYKSDGVSIEQKTDGTNTTFSVYGFGSAGAGIMTKRNGKVEYITVGGENGLYASEDAQGVSFGIEGWDAPQCSTSIAAMLTSNATDRATHKVLCRRTTASGTEMHYAAIGDLSGFSSSVKADDVTITTNSTGVASIKGFSSASTGSVPYRTSSGSMAWGGALECEGERFGSVGTSLEEDSQLGLSSFDVSVSEGNATFSLVCVPLTYVENVSYDTETHKLVQTKRTVMTVVVREDDPVDSDVFTAVPHSGL